MEFPNDASVQECLGFAQLHDGRLNQAQTAFERALKLDKSMAAAHCGLSDVFAARGQKAEAEQAIRSAIRVAPKFGHAWLRLAHLKRFRKAQDPDFRQLKTIATSTSAKPQDREPLSFALAKAFDDLGCPDDAFRFMRLANELHRKDNPFDVDTVRQLTTRIASVCSDDYFRNHVSIGSDSSLPVFIVGLPRSGSSLVEQIIASHPNAIGVGELGTLPRLAADLPHLIKTKTPFPECMRELTPKVAEHVASQYLQRIKRDAPQNTLRICDKMLSNLMLIGVIATIFPNAKLLHCKRNIMDVGLSMYQQLFQGSGAGYTYDLDDIGRYHRLSQALMTHWKEVSPTRIVEVEYEELVRNPEQESRRLIDAIGLPWDNACLDANRRKASTQTASNWQVRQPVHTRSVERWRPYAKHLAALEKYLD